MNNPKQSSRVVLLFAFLILILCIGAAKKGDVVSVTAAHSYGEGEPISVTSTEIGDSAETLFVAVRAEDIQLDQISATLDLSATPIWDPFPSGDPAWTLEKKPEAAEELSDSPGVTFSYDADVLGLYQFKATHIESAAVNIQLFSLDLDIDSDNDNGFDTPSGSDEEEMAEEEGLGKVVLVNDGFSDDDVVPGFADGIGLNSVEGDDLLEGVKFVPITVSFPKIDGMDDATISFDYNSSDPAGVIVSQTQDENGEWTYEFSPAEPDQEGGSLRIWTKDAHEVRDPAPVSAEDDSADFVPPNKDLDPEAIGITDSNRMVTLYVEGIHPSKSIGDAVISVLVDTDGDEEGASISPVETDSVVLTLLKMDVVPDYDRDGVIREFAETVDNKVRPSDYTRAASEDPFHFWINDDDDSAVDSGDDIPGSGTADASNVSVDGIRDIIDFFPVFIDFHGLLDDMDVTKVQIELIGAKVNWLNFPDSFIGLTKTSAGFYLENQVKAEEWANASVTQAGEGVYFTEKMVERIRDGRGIVLLEGREAGDEALTLVFNYDGNEFFTFELPTKLSGVEDMFSHVNLVDELAHGEGIPVEVSDRAGEPAGFPDSESNDQYFAFIHGYNVSQQNARGWNAEIFKRMYWAGSKAKFVGLTWHGKVDPNYHKAVINAFETGDHLASGLSSFSGDLTIAAHSLGNIVVSHAITDGGFSPARYFMLNAASPIEAYDSVQTSNSSSANMQYNMAHSEWRDTHGTRLWASHWHELFPGEARAELTWRDRFGDLGGVAYNFYSSGEDVVANAPNSAITYVDALVDLVGNGGFGAWYIQEKTKGLFGTLSHGDGFVFRADFPDQHGGWRISGYQRDPTDNEPYDDPAYYAGQSSDFLRTVPLFSPFGFAHPPAVHENDRYPTYDATLLLAPAGDATANAQAAIPTTQHKLLAEAIPALSFAVATNPVDVFDNFSGNRNYNVNTQFQNGWPQERLSGVSGNNWLHSDLKNIPYVYIHEYYDKFVEIGGFDQ